MYQHALNTTDWKIFRHSDVVSKKISKAKVKRCKRYYETHFSYLVELENIKKSGQWTVAKKVEFLNTCISTVHVYTKRNAHEKAAQIWVAWIYMYIWGMWKNVNLKV